MNCQPNDAKGPHLLLLHKAYGRQARSLLHPRTQPRWGWLILKRCTQGSSFLATLGFVAESLWDSSNSSPNRSVMMSPEDEGAGATGICGDGAPRAENPGETPGEPAGEDVCATAQSGALGQRALPRSAKHGADCRNHPTYHD